MYWEPFDVAIISEYNFNAADNSKYPDEGIWADGVYWDFFCVEYGSLNHPKAHYVYSCESEKIEKYPASTDTMKLARDYNGKFVYSEGYVVSNMEIPIKQSGSEYLLDMTDDKITEMLKNDFYSDYYSDWDYNFLEKSIAISEGEDYVEVNLVWSKTVDYQHYGVERLYCGESFECKLAYDLNSDLKTAKLVYAYIDRGFMGGNYNGCEVKYTGNTVQNMFMRLSSKIANYNSDEYQLVLPSAEKTLELAEKQINMLYAEVSDISLKKIRITKYNGTFCLALNFDVSYLDIDSENVYNEKDYTITDSTWVLISLNAKSQ